MFNNSNNTQGPDLKNIILAVSVSLTILFTWQLFFAPPSPPPQEQAYQEGQGSNGDAISPSPQQFSDLDTRVQQAIVSRDDIVKQGERISIKSSVIEGSINLQGLRIDDVTLTKYRESIDSDSPNIILLSPSGTQHPYFAQFGWTSSSDVSLPNKDTIWHVVSTEDMLTPDTPLIVEWANEQDITFRVTITMEDDYLFTIKQDILNNSDQAITAAPWGLINRLGHKELEDFYILHEGFLGVLEDSLEETSYDDVLDDGPQKFNGHNAWLGITDKYWLTSLIPNADDEVHASFSGYKGVTPRYQADYLYNQYTVAPNSEFTKISRLYAGAKIASLAQEYQDMYNIYQFDLSIDFGILYFLTKPMYIVLDYIQNYVHNFGVAIIILTFIIKLLLFPLAHKSYTSMAKMKLLQPKMMDLKERYGDDRMKLQQEMMGLYKKEQVNPMSGCLPILIQIPIFFALYKVLFVTIEMRHAPFFGWIHDLSAPDPLGVLTGFGLVPWDVPAILVLFNLGLWPIFMGVTMWLQQRLNPTPQDPIQAKIFAWMPIMFTFLLASFPAGLVIYWTVNNVLTIAQQYTIMRSLGSAPSLFKINKNE